MFFKKIINLFSKIGDKKSDNNNNKDIIENKEPMIKQLKKKQ